MGVSWKDAIQSQFIILQYEGDTFDNCVPIIRAEDFSEEVICTMLSSLVILTGIFCAKIYLCNLK